MLAYYLAFALLALLALLDEINPRYRGGTMQAVPLTVMWLSAIIALTAFLGFRFQVGGDWENYEGILEQAYIHSLPELLATWDPAYIFINWASAILGGDIIGVNVTCGLIFALCITFFCRGLPLPWLGMTVAFPYLIVVVAMGYTRQGVALGLEMAALVVLSRRSIVWFIVLGLVGATFHKSAVLLLPLAIVVPVRRRGWSIVLALAGTALGYRALLQSSTEGLVENYITAEYQSQGAFVRCAMNVVPAVLFLLARRRYGFSVVEQRIWTLFSLLSIVLLLASRVSSATTAVDRIALYMLPLQLAIFSRTPIAFDDFLARPMMVGVIITYYLIVLIVWLNFADNASYWVPYKSYLF